MLSSANCHALAYAVLTLNKQKKKKDFNDQLLVKKLA
jgi:hypothetical protein